MNVYDLPTEICGHKIRSDYRACLDIIMCFEDTELTDSEKLQIMVDILFVDEIEINKELIEKSIEFLDVGKPAPKKNAKNVSPYGRLYSWKQDARYIFSAIDKVLGYSVRSCEYLHWWEFIGAFYEIGECTFANILHMRKSKKRGKLTKEEKQEWAENRELYELESEFSKEEQNQIDAFMRLVEGGKV